MPTEGAESSLSDREKMISEWLLGSGILNRNYWAFHHSYNAFRKTYGPLYTEVTGYGLSLFLNLLNWSKDFNLPKDYAPRLAEFIHSSKTRIGEDKSAFRFGYYLSAEIWDRQAYSFDTGMCISAMLDLNRLNSRTSLAQDAVECGIWLTKDMQNGDGSFKTCMDTKSRQYVGIQSWFGDRGCLHGKIAISLCKLYEHTGDRVFNDSFNRSLKWLLSMQRPSGGFLARQGEDYVFTHSHCYASEALAFAYWKTEQKEYLNGFRRSVGWLVQHQNRDGSYNQSYGLRIPNAWKRVDATAQACRLLVLMHLIEPHEAYVSAAHKAADFMVSSLIAKTRDKGASRGLCSKLFLFLRWPELTSWTNMFAVHALHLLRKIEAYDFTEAVRELF
jgi:hypothetical protein